MWGIIATWKMAEKGVHLATNGLENNGNILDAVEACVKDVEENPDFSSVGYGGLPNEHGVVELDAAFMNGEDLSVGAVASVKDFLNPCSIARSLMDSQFNNFLAGAGAEVYAQNKGFKRQNMLTESARKHWQEHKKKIHDERLSPYAGHDTVCAAGVDKKGRMATCTSTSGLFYKAQGRVGDSPIPGAGYYVDSDIGGACATGLGEDIMKGCICYEIVRLMKSGLSAQLACEKATLDLHNSLTRRRGKAGDISVVAMNHKGEYGAATNRNSFPFVVGNEQGVKVVIAGYKNGRIITGEQDD
ncbi:MAG: N(4)-(beta-N-acetylglucosaminyl)-L-asparaginase [Planctomycetota bacterium]